MFDDNYESTLFYEDKESICIALRLTELAQNPTIGAYDIKHLKKIHAYIFQDIPALQREYGDQNDIYQPGSFRPPVEKGFYWAKDREPATYPQSKVIYSPMRDDDILDMQKALAKLSTRNLSRLNEKEFTEEIASLYSKLDYIHPFMEGNSRTLREFTRTLALESGFNIAWANFEKSANAMDALFIARYLSVNEITVRRICSEKVLANAEKTAKISLDIKSCRSCWRAILPVLPGRSGIITKVF